MAVWQIQEAKAKLSEFVNEAKHEPQIISRHGKPEVIAMSIDHYKTLVSAEGDVVSFFRKSPLFGIDLDITRDKSGSRDIDL